MTRTLRFVSTGSKFEETKLLLAEHGITVLLVKRRLKELQIVDVEALVKDKVIKAFEITGRPVFVEHTGLYLDILNGMPGGLTRLFWERLEKDRFCELFGRSSNPKVTARTVIAYCDARTIHPLFSGEVSGRIAESPRGDAGFGWDCVFIPDESAEGKTFSELGDEKNEISMRRRALDEFGAFLSGHP